MPRAYHKSLEYPLGGLNKSTSYARAQPYFTASANNFWPYQWSTGRARGGTRLGIDQLGSSTPGSAPRNWSPVTWTASNVTYRGVAVACAGGAYISTTGSFTEAITTAAASDFCSCTTFNNDLYFARFGELALVRTLTSPGTGAGTTVDADWSEGFEETPGSGVNGGTPPNDCGLVCVHQNRLVFAGSQASPQILFMSRAGYPKDWDTTKEDQGAAWATSSGESGKIGEPITALIPHTHGCLLIGCTDSMYVVRGNPTASNAVDMLVSNIGPLSQAAWCKTTNGWTYMLTRDGLYRFPPGCPQGAPEPVSRKNLPEELVAIDPGTLGTYVSIAYDPRWMGIHIYVNRSGDNNTYYFYDIVNEGFWPMTFSQTMRLAVTHPVLATTTDSALLAITSGGSSYQFTTDSSESIASHCVYGPILLAPQGMEGLLNEVIAVLAENSSAVSWKLYVADSAAEAYALVNADTASFTGTNWAVSGSRFLQYVQTPLRRGQCCYLKIYASGSTARISVEEIELKSLEAGPRRVL